MEEVGSLYLDKTQCCLAEKEVVPGYWICSFHLGPSLWIHRPLWWGCVALGALLVKLLPLRSGLGHSTKEAEAQKVIQSLGTLFSG